MDRTDDAVETGAHLICPHCDTPIEKFRLIRRELDQRTPFGGRVYVQALACPACHKLVGFYHAEF
jgi:C4-type Zn-finger protein